LHFAPEKTTTLSAMAAAGAGQFLTGIFLKDTSECRQLYRAGRKGCWMK
jgi:hypothetical protein